MNRQTVVRSTRRAGPLPAGDGSISHAVSRGWQPPPQMLSRERSNGFFTTALAAYVFMLASLLNEFLVAYAGVHLPLVAIFSVLIIVMYLISGQPQRFFRTSFAFPWVALLAWWFLAGLTGFYPRRTIEYMVPYAIRLHSLPLIICAIAPDLRGLKRVLFGAGFGVVVVLLFCVKFGTMAEDRFIVPDTSLANANDLGMRLLLYGAMFLVFLSAGWKGRLLTLFTMPVLAYYVLRTGSRANLITLAILVVISLAILPAKKKVVILTVAIVLPVFAIPFLPRATTERLQTFFSADRSSSSVLESNAVDSTNARLQLQERAIELSMNHLLLGVGPLNFEDSVEEMVHAKYGIKSGWQVAHNSYLQVSAESGLPGLIFYVWSIVLCLKMNYRSFRNSTGDRNLLSFSLLLASVVYAEGIFFCSIPYDYFLALLVGLTASNYLGCQAEFSAPVTRQSAAGIAGIPLRRLPRNPRASI